MKERDLDKVIDEILAVIPATETSFIAQLQSLKSSVLFRPPELLYECWREMQVILGEQRIPHDPDAMKPWQLQVTKIWINGRITLVPKKPVILLVQGKPVRFDTDHGGLEPDGATVFNADEVERVIENDIQYCPSLKREDYQVVRLFGI